MPGGSSKSHDICFARVDNRSRQKQPATGHCMVPSQMAQFDPNQTRFQERRGLSDSTPGCSSSSIMAVGRSGILLTGLRVKRSFAAGASRSPGVFCFSVT